MFPGPSSRVGELDADVSLRKLTIGSDTLVSISDGKRVIITCSTVKLQIFRSD